MYISDNMHRKEEIMGERFNQAKYIQEYQKEKYDRCIFNVPKGDKEKIQEHYKKLGYVSLNQYINELVRRDMNQNANEKADIKIENIDNEGGTIHIG